MGACLLTGLLATTTRASSRRLCCSSWSLLSHRLHVNSNFGTSIFAGLSFAPSVSASVFSNSSEHPICLRFHALHRSSDGSLPARYALADRFPDISAPLSCFLSPLRRGLGRRSQPSSSGVEVHSISLVQQLLVCLGREETLAGCRSL